MANSTDELRARLALARARVALHKGFWNRWPAGSEKGGQFAPKASTGIGGGPAKGGGGMFGAWGSKASQYASYVAGLKGGAGPKPAAGSGILGPQFGGSAPKGPPPGSAQHPKANDKGAAVTINYPTKPSHQSTWSDHNKTAVFTPGSDAPAVLNNVAMKPWNPPKDGWSKVPGTKESLEADMPFEATPGKTVGAGVVIMEPDGRLWLTRPTNAFGGYQNTYPKGTVESGLTMQQNAVKEAWEETGLKVKITGILGDYERDTSKARFYIAQRVGGTPKGMGWESQAINLATLKDARKLLNREHDRGILDDLEDLIALSKSKTAPKGGFWTNQPRWPGGSALGGQWKATDADGITIAPKIAGGLEGTNSNYQKAAIAVYTSVKNGDLKTAQAVIDKYAAANEKFATGVKGTSHVKYGAQTYQYAVQAVGDYKAKISATATADAIIGPQKLSHMAYEGPKPGGSNPGAMYVDDSGKWLVKGSNASNATPRSHNEVLASKLMAAAGVGAPEMKLVDLQGTHGGGIGVASKWIEGGVAFDKSNPAHISLAQQDFAVHAWLANYDAIGMDFDNTQIINGKAANIDPGGALLYRAQGAPKMDFGNEVTEFDSLRKPVQGVPVNHSAHAVYGSMTASQIAESAKKVAAISDETIKKLVSTYAPDTVDKAAFADKIIARKYDLLTKVAALEAKAAPPPAPAPAAVGEAGYIDTIAQLKGTHYGAISAKFVHTTVAFKVDEIINENLDPVSITVGIDNALEDDGEKFKFADIGVEKFPVIFQTQVSKMVKNGELRKLSKDVEALLGQAQLYKSIGAPDMVKQKAQMAAYMAAAIVQIKADQAKAAKAIVPPPAAPIQKPTFNSGFEKADKFYADIANKLQTLHAAGNLAGLKTFEGMKTAYTDGGKQVPWKPGTGNGMKMAIYHAELVSDLEKKSAAQVIVAANAADKVISTPVPPPPKNAPVTTALPNFAAAMLPLTNTNAASHNGKIDAIAKLANAGDVKGLLSLNFGTNTYGKKQANLANDALTALGSPEKVQAGQKSGAHPALHGGATPAAVIAAAATTKVQPPTPAPPVETPKSSKPAFKPDNLTAPPNFNNWNNGGKGLSSKDWVNQSNTAVAAAIYTAAKTGDMSAVKAVAYEVLDKETGAKTGVFKPASEHPSQHIKAYQQNLIQEIDLQLNPPKMPRIGVQASGSIAEVSSQMPPVPSGKSIAAVPQNQKAGRYIVLGKASLTEKEPPEDNSVATTSAWQNMAKQHYASASDSAKQTFSTYLSSSGASALNTALRTGNTSTNVGGKSVEKHVKDFEKLLVDIPEGTTFTRNMGMKGFGETPNPKYITELQQFLMSAEKGTVVQEPGFSSASFGSQILSNNDIKWNLRAGKGVKAFPAWLTANTGEAESLFPPNTRYMILSAKKKGKTVYVDAVLLPNS